MTTPYRLPPYVLRGSLAWWTAPRTRWTWSRWLRWVMVSYPAWHYREKRHADDWMRAIRRLLLIHYTQADQLNLSVLHYHHSMLRGERGRRELEEYFSRS